jgi:hypothetical protein
MIPQIRNRIFDFVKVFTLVLGQLVHVNDGHQNITHFIPNMHPTIFHQLEIFGVNVDKVLQNVTIEIRVLA